MITTKEASVILGVSQRRVQAMVKSRVLPAEKVSGVWLIDETGVRGRLTKPVKPGRPRRGFKEDDRRFILMKKDAPVFEFTCSAENYEATQVLETFDANLIPIGVRMQGMRPSLYAFREWLQQRKMPDSRIGRQRYYQGATYGSTSELAYNNLGVSAVDQYWIKPEADSDTKWRDLSPFLNEYQDIVGGNPTATTGGRQEKHWERREGRNVLLKRGGAEGREPYNEVLATKTLQKLLEPSEFVRYWLVIDGDAFYSACDGFIDEDTEYVSMANILRTYGLEHEGSDYETYCQACKAHGLHDIRTALSKMLAFDFLLANGNRTADKVGIIRDSETGEWLRPAPLFDHGDAFYANETDPQKLRDQLLPYASGPFSEYPTRQLSLIADFSWFDPRAFAGFGGEIVATLRGNENISSEIANAVAAQFQRRLDRLTEVASEHESSLEGVSVSLWMLE